MASAAAQRGAALRTESSRWATALRELGAVDHAMYEAVARTPTPSLDGPFRRLSDAASYSRLWLGIAAVLAALGGHAVSRHYPELAVPLRLLTGAVAYSRVHVGVHYPGDVAVGAIVAGNAATIAVVGDRLTGRGRTDQSV